MELIVWGVVLTSPFWLFLIIMLLINFFDKIDNAKNKRRKIRRQAIKRMKPVVDLCQDLQSNKDKK